ncbi:nitroreductase family protein, partial [Streptomyces sp. NPDC003343]
MTLQLDPAAQNLLFRDAHTANTFTDEPVTDEQVRAVYDLVKYAPTAYNQQPMRVVLVRTPESRERLVGHMTANNAPKTAAAPLVAILAADNEFHEELPNQFPTRRCAVRSYGGSPRTPPSPDWPPRRPRIRRSS